MILHMYTSVDHSGTHSVQLVLNLSVRPVYCTLYIIRLPFQYNRHRVICYVRVGEFDMRVKSCAASDGGGHVIQLTDDQGCVLRPKMISGFLKARTSDERASVITYAFFHAFKFPDALSVHIRCKVEICRHGCLDHCQTDERSSTGHLLQQQQTSGVQYGPAERKDQQNDQLDYVQSVGVNTDQPSAQAQTALHTPFTTAAGHYGKPQSSQKVIKNNSFFFFFNYRISRFEFSFTYS